MKVFLDLDGVLVNFGEGIYRAFNKEYNYPGLPREWFWYRDWGVNDAEFDSVCDRQFFASLRWMHDGVPILAAVKEKFGADNIYLLTTPMNNPGSWSGKIDWVLRHLPEYRKRLILTQVPKSLFVGPNAILIDDKDENIEEFVAAGGQGILVPRPWNKLCQRANIAFHLVKDGLEEF